MRSEFEYEDIDRHDNSRTKGKLMVAAGILILMALVGTTASLNQNSKPVSVEQREAIGTTLEREGLHVQDDFFDGLRDDHEIFVKDDWSNPDEESYIHMAPEEVSEDYSVLRPFPLGGRIRFCKAAIRMLMQTPSAHVVQKTVRMRNGMTSYKGKKVYIIIITPPSGRYYHGRYMSGAQHIYSMVRAICSRPMPPGPHPGPGPFPPRYTTTRYRPPFYTSTFYRPPVRYTTPRPYRPFTTPYRRYTTPYRRYTTPYRRYTTPYRRYTTTYRPRGTTRYHFGTSRFHAKEMEENENENEEEEME